MLRLFAFIVSAVIGSGIFITPYNMSQYGLVSLIGFLITTFVFTHMISIFTSIGDIPSFLRSYLGNKIASVISLFYWFISWTSTLVVINEMILYLVVLVPSLIKFKLTLQISSVLFFILINLFGIKKSSKIEITITLFKILPLVIFPLIFLILRPTPIKDIVYTKGNVFGLFRTIPSVVWCFLGIECVNIINNQLHLTEKQIKIASYSAILAISLIYFSNISIIFYLLGTGFSSPRPYVDIIFNYMGYFGKDLFSFVVFVVCFGTSNTWILSSGMMAKDLSNQNLLPKFLSKENNYGSPAYAIVCSSIGLIPMFVLLQKQSLAQSMFKVLDISCIGIMLFYGAIALANFKRRKNTISLFCFGFFIFCFLFLTYGEIKSFFTSF